MSTSQKITQPTVSVVIPVFQNEAYLDTAISSVLNQTFNDFELIIVADASHDKKKNIARMYYKDKRLHYCRADEGLSIGALWNQGLTLANGKYIKMLAPEDALASECLETMVNILENHSLVSIATSFEFYLDGIYSGTKQGYIREYGEIKGGLTSNNYYLLENSFIGGPSAVMFRKEKLPTGLLKSELNHNLFWDFWLRMLSKGNLYVIPCILYYTRRYKQNEKTLLKHTVEAVKEKTMLINRSFKRSDEYGISSEERAKDLIENSIALIASGEPSKNSIIILASLVLYFFHGRNVELFYFCTKLLFFYLIKYFIEVLFKVAKRIIRTLSKILPGYFKLQLERFEGWLSIKRSKLIKENYSYKFIEIPIKDLRARIITAKGIKPKPIKDTPHFKWLSSLVYGKEDLKCRKDYLDYIKQYHTQLDPEGEIRKAEGLVKTIKTRGFNKISSIEIYPWHNNSNSDQSGYYIRDGIHRASIAKAMGESSIQACIIHFR